MAQTRPPKVPFFPFTPRRLLAWAGSLAVGIVLMSVLFLVLIWTTFLEFAFGTEVAVFAVYGSGWFALLQGFLGLNVFCAVLVRFPWKYKHLPFLIAHGGVLILLLGCYATWQSGEEASLSLYEGTASSVARRNEQCFEVRSISLIANDRDEDAGADGMNAAFGPDRGRDTLGGRKTILPFRPGPFGWSDYNRENWLKNYASDPKDLSRDPPRRAAFLTVPLRWAMLLATRNTGRLHPLNGDAALEECTVEVLDYHANAEIRPAIPLELSVLFDRPPRSGAPASPSADPATPPSPPVSGARRGWESVSLTLPFPSMYGLIPPTPSVRKTLEGGERIVYSMAGSQAEVDAFLSSAPKNFAQAGSDGQIVLSSRGRTYHLNVLEFFHHDTGGRPLGDSGFSVELVRFDPARSAVQLEVFAPNGRRGRLALFADRPEMNMHASVLGVFGTYWRNVHPARAVDAAGDADRRVSTDNRPDSPRIDILQGPGAKLYYRYWTGKAFIASGEIPTRTGANAFLTADPISLGSGTPDAATISVEKFVPCELPGCRLASRPVSRKNAGHPATQAAKLRVSFDGTTEEFWIRAMLPTTIPQPPAPDQVRYLYGRDKTLRIVWNYRLLDLGFGLYLRRFEQKNEPGTRMAAGFSSLVDQVRFNNPATSETGDPASFDVFRGNVLIRMNRPGIFRAPNGRTYRFYQSSRSGPYRPSDPDFWYAYDGRPLAGEHKPRESITMSTLSISYDPGRGFKYLGSFLLVFGTAWLIFRRWPCIHTADV